MVGLVRTNLQGTNSVIFLLQVLSHVGAVVVQGIVPCLHNLPAILILPADKVHGALSSTEVCEVREPAPCTHPTSPGYETQAENVVGGWGWKI